MIKMLKIILLCMIISGLLTCTRWAKRSSEQIPAPTQGNAEIQLVKAEGSLQQLITTVKRLEDFLQLEKDITANLQAALASSNTALRLRAQAARKQLAERVAIEKANFTVLQAMWEQLDKLRTEWAETQASENQDPKFWQEKLIAADQQFEKSLPALMTVKKGSMLTETWLENVLTKKIVPAHNALMRLMGEGIRKELGAARKNVSTGFEGLTQAMCTKISLLEGKSSTASMAVQNAITNFRGHSQSLVDRLEHMKKDQETQTKFLEMVTGKPVLLLIPSSVVVNGILLEKEAREYELLMAHLQRFQVP